jgi:hypothetical protein
MRYEPPTGAGLAQGRQPNLMKQVFYKAIFSMILPRPETHFFSSRRVFQHRKTPLKREGRPCQEYLRSFLLVKDEGYFTVRGVCSCGQNYS